MTDADLTPNSSIGGFAADDPEPLLVTVSAEVSGMRLDRALAVLFPQFSRSRLKTWVGIYRRSDLGVAITRGRA